MQVAKNAVESVCSVRKSLLKVLDSAALTLILEGDPVAGGLGALELFPESA